MRYKNAITSRSYLPRGACFTKVDPFAGRSRSNMFDVCGSEVLRALAFAVVASPFLIVVAIVLSLKGVFQ